MLSLVIKFSSQEKPMANIKFKDLSFDSFCDNLTAIREAEVVSALFSGTLFSAQTISAAEDGVFLILTKE
jgi:hypothetical protein